MLSRCPSPDLLFECLWTKQNQFLQSKCKPQNWTPTPPPKTPPLRTKTHPKNRKEKVEHEHGPPFLCLRMNKGKKEPPMRLHARRPTFQRYLERKTGENQPSGQRRTHRWSRSGCNRSDHSGRGPTRTLSQHGQIFGGTDEEVTPPCKEKPLPRSARPLASTLPPSTSSRQRKKGKGERRKKRKAAEARERERREQ